MKASRWSKRSWCSLWLYSGSQNENSRKRLFTIVWKWCINQLPISYPFARLALRGSLRVTLPILSLWRSTHTTTIVLLRGEDFQGWVARILNWSSQQNVAPCRCKNYRTSAYYICEIGKSLPRQHRQASSLSREVSGKEMSGQVGGWIRLFEYYYFPIVLY